MTVGLCFIVCLGLLGIIIDFLIVAFYWDTVPKDHEVSSPFCLGSKHMLGCASNRYVGPITIMYVF